MKLHVAVACLLGVLVHANMAGGDSASTNCLARRSDKMMVCYYTNWAMYRPAPGNIKPSDVDPCLCTHALYGFCPFSGNALAPTSDDTTLWSQMNAWKKTNPDLKILISVGGWNAGTWGFTQIVASQSNMDAFAQSTISTCRQYGLDGIDIDWEYPTADQKSQYTQFIKTLRLAFEKEAQQSGQARLLVSAATAPDSARMVAYDLPSLTKYFDFINPMTYDIHGGWDGNPSHHSSYEDTIATLQNYNKGGFEASKLNLGMAFYGRCSGSAALGTYTRENGFLAYYEVCQLHSKSGFTDNPLKHNPKSSGSGGYCFYDNGYSLAEKAQWVVDHNFGGSFVWDLSMDDFGNNFCCQGKFPLLKTALYQMNGLSVPNADMNLCAGGSAATTIATAAPTATSLATTTAAAVSSASSSATAATSSTSSAAAASTTQAPSNFLPSGTCTYLGELLPYPYDCGKYELCQNGSVVVQTCGSGLYFNPAKGVCDWPKNVNCNAIPFPTSAPATASSTPAAAATTAAAASSTTASPSTASALSGCKEAGQFLAHPTDCAKMILCLSATSAIEVQCGLGLYFNPKISACDWPANVDCSH